MKKTIASMLVVLLLALTVTPAVAAPKNPAPSPGIDIGGGVTLYPDGAKDTGKGGKGGGITPQSSRTIKIQVTMLKCTTFYNPVPFWDPQGCEPAAWAYWSWKYYGAPYWQSGTGTDANGVGVMYIPVVNGQYGTIYFQGYAGFMCSANYDPNTTVLPMCWLYSIK